MKMEIEKLEDAIKVLKLTREQKLEVVKENIELKNHIADLELELIILKEKNPAKW